MKKKYYALNLIFFISFSAVAQKLPSADAIIARYVHVIGGEKKWAEVKTSEFHAKIYINNKILDLLIIKAGPERFYQSIKDQGFSSIILYEQKKGVVIKNASKERINDKIILDHYELQSCILPDMNYKQLHYKRQVVGIKNINGIQCYQIRLTSKNGSINFNYYEKKSGLLTMIEKSGVKTFLTDYKSYKGCSIPFTLTTELGKGQNMICKVTDWVINDNSTVEQFNIRKQQIKF